MSGQKFILVAKIILVAAPANDSVLTSTKAIRLIEDGEKESMEVGLEVGYTPIATPVTTRITSTLRWTVMSILGRSYHKYHFCRDKNDTCGSSCQG